MARFAYPARRVAGRRRRVAARYMKRGRINVRIPRGLQGYIRRNGAYGTVAERRAELKTLHHSIVITAIDETHEIPSGANGTEGVNLVGVGQGVGYNQRVGRVIMVKSFELRGAAIYGPDPGNAYTLMDLWVVMDTQTNGASALASEVLTGTSAAAAIRNPIFLQRFKILAHRQVNLTPQAFKFEDNSVPQGNAAIKPFYVKHRFPGRGLAIEYSQLASSPSVPEQQDLRTNSIFIIWGTTGSDDNVSVRASWQMKYTDA